MNANAYYYNKANNAVLCADTMRKIVYCNYRSYNMRECPNGAYKFNVMHLMDDGTEVVITIRCEYDENMVSRYGICNLYMPLSKDSAKHYDGNLLSDKIKDNAELKQFVESLCFALCDIYSKEHIHIL